MGITIRGLRCGHNDIQWGFQSGPDSAGGVSVKGTLINTDERTIKYVTLRFVPFNAVNDVVQCTIKRVSDYGLECTGPIPTNKPYAFFGENMWYNHSIVSIAISRVEIQYMDGTKETIPGNQVTMETAGSGKSGCYVATAVYGYYECPQVWTLRRYRDYTLAGTWYGRLFIHAYYAVSPTLVRWFGHTSWFRKMWKGKLDRMVARLNAEGVEDTPYEDISWR